MKKIYLHSLILILLILQSCAFEPKGEAFVTLDSTGITPDIQINLNLAADTIFVPSHEKIIFAYGLHGDKVNWARFLVNGNEQNMRDFEYDIVDYSKTFDDSPGVTYTLAMEIFARSQTGSIADKLHAEGYLISGKWIVVIKNDDQMASHIIKAEFVDGSLRIEWEKYKGVDFKNYKLYKNMPYAHPNMFLLASINAKEQTSFVDTTYHGEQSQYYIVNNDRFRGTSLQVKGPIPVLTAENTANGDILLKWDKSPYYKNLRGYRISYKDRYGNLQQVTEVPIGYGESFIIPNPLFAHNYEFYVTPVGLSANYYEAWSSTWYLSTTAKAAYGVSIPFYTDALSGQDPITYLLNGTQGILQFDHRTFTTTRRIKYKETIYQFKLSPNNKYLVARVSNPQKIYFEDLTDSTKSKSIDISASFPQMQYVATVSNAGTGIMINNKTAVLYDYINERKLAEILLTSSGTYSNRISASGNFFYLGTSSSSEYYQYKDNRIVLLQSGNNQGVDLMANAEYLPGNNEKLVRAFRNRVEVVDCKTWTIEKTWLFPSQIWAAYNLDSKTGKILLSDKLKLTLFDVINGTNEQLATLDDFGYLDWSFFYSNGYLFWGQGKAIKIN